MCLFLYEFNDIQKAISEYFLNVEKWRTVCNWGNAMVSVLACENIDYNI